MVISLWSSFSDWMKSSFFMRFRYSSRLTEIVDRELREGETLRWFGTDEADMKNDAIIAYIMQ